MQGRNLRISVQNDKVRSMKGGEEMRQVEEDAARDKLPPHVDEEQLRTLWVGGISEKVDEEILFELFQNAGPLQRVTIPSDKETKKKKNYAFIVFHHAESVKYAFDLLNGTELFGMKIKCQNKTTGLGIMPIRQNSGGANYGRGGPGQNFNYNNDPRRGGGFDNDQNFGPQGGGGYNNKMHSRSFSTSSLGAMQNFQGNEMMGNPMMNPMMRSGFPMQMQQDGQFYEDNMNQQQHQQFNRSFSGSRDRDFGRDNHRGGNQQDFSRDDRQDRQESHDRHNRNYSHDNRRGGNDDYYDQQRRSGGGGRQFERDSRHYNHHQQFEKDSRHHNQYRDRSNESSRHHRR